MRKKMIKGRFAPPALSTLSQPELSSLLGGPSAQPVKDCWGGRGGVVGVNGMGKSLSEPTPWRHNLEALKDMSSSLDERGAGNRRSGLN